MTEDEDKRFAVPRDTEFKRGIEYEYRLLKAISSDRIIAQCVAGILPTATYCMIILGLEVTDLDLNATSLIVLNMSAALIWFLASTLANINSQLSLQHSITVRAAALSDGVLTRSEREQFTDELGTYALSNQRTLEASDDVFSETIRKSAFAVAWRLGLLALPWFVLLD